jgi:hypothetical protein
MSFSAKYSVAKIQEILNKAKGLKAPIDRKTANAVGDAVVETVKSEIARGMSPIAGKGPFPPYKKPDRYPGKRKSKSPVNLYLSGDFQDSLGYSTFQNNTGFGTEIGYSSKEEVKEEGHRAGKNGQPRRPSLPSGRGEDFNSKIKKVFFAFYNERVKSLWK